MQQRDLANLLKECTALVQIPARQRDGYYGRAQVLMEIGDLDQALADAQLVISLLPDAVGYCCAGTSSMRRDN